VLWTDRASAELKRQDELDLATAGRLLKSHWKGNAFFEQLALSERLQIGSGSA